MTPEQLESVQRTAAIVEQARDRCAERFYDHLFERRPPARRLFADDLIAQRSTLVEELLRLVAAAADLPAFLPRPGSSAGATRVRASTPPTTPSSVTP